MKVWGGGVGQSGCFAKLVDGENLCEAIKKTLASEKGTNLHILPPLQIEGSMSGHYSFAKKFTSYYFWTQLTIEKMLCLWRKLLPRLDYYTRVARFFQYTIYQNGENITNDHKIYQIAVK
jgi:hypothetical protein